MYTILLHSSKTMRHSSESTATYQRPLLQDRADELMTYLQTLSIDEIQAVMKVSTRKATDTKQLFSRWSKPGKSAMPAIDAFIGDIYSGLQTQTLSPQIRNNANHSLYILSGLYGVLRALDSIQPYRLEMGYRLPAAPYRNLYQYWGASLAQQLPSDRTIINVSSVEYTKAVFPHLSEQQRVITPRFLTRNSTGEPTFVVVHAKIARGAFAHWLLTYDISRDEDVPMFDELGYAYEKSLSSSEEPVFVCDTFGGLGLSVRLS